MSFAMRVDKSAEWQSILFLRVQVELSVRGIMKAKI